MIFNPENDERQLIHTRTGEPYQPVRLYFQLFNRKTVEGVFKKLRCVQPGLNADHWQWLYDQETKKLRFDVSYNKLPKDYRPLVLADIFFRDDEMLMDLRSFQRASYAADFFYKRINPHAACLTHARLVNRFFDGTVENPEKIAPPFDQFFEREDVYIPDMEAMDRKLAEITEQYEDLDERSAAFTEYLDAQSKQKLPEIEQLPIHVYEDKTTVGFNLALMLRHLQASQHWIGDTSFTQSDAINILTQNMRDELEEFED